MSQKNEHSIMRETPNYFLVFGKCEVTPCCLYRDSLTLSEKSTKKSDKKNTGHRCVHTCFSLRRK